AVSFKNPQFSINTSTIGSTTLLEAVKNSEKDIKFYQASSSEMFGGEKEELLNEKSIFSPKSPYAAGKLFAYNMTKIYRESYNVFGSNGILFNHESPYRGETFVTRKITRGLARIKLGIQDCLYLGNLNAKRDWGHARDYVEMQWLMLQQDIPQDFVIATGSQYSVREFIEQAASALGMVIEWKGEGLDEVGLNNGRVIIKIDPKYFRPAEVETLLGDASKAQDVLGWSPKISFAD
ncbi:MAG: GDP-mannose 4,6-dehydratase, partial [Burkholderiaceae bacterium]